jgi:hypothetical protein
MCNNLLEVDQPLTKLLHIIDIPIWGLGFIPCNVFSQIENDDDLVEII